MCNLSGILSLSSDSPLRHIDFQWPHILNNMFTLIIMILCNWVVFFLRIIQNACLIYIHFYTFEVTYFLVYWLCRFLMHSQVVIHLQIRMYCCLILPCYSSKVFFFSLFLLYLNYIFLTFPLMERSVAVSGLVLFHIHTLTLLLFGK